MSKIPLVALVCCILSSCSTTSTPAPVEQPKPLGADPRLCVESEKEPPVVGSIVGPVTEQEREATRQHLTSDADARSWGRRGWERAEIARSTVCS